MTYAFDFATLPFRVSRSERAAPPVVPQPNAQFAEIVEDQLHTHAYVRRRSDTVPENCTAIYHTADGDWLELDVGPESQVGQRAMPDVKILNIERM